MAAAFVVTDSTGQKLAYVCFEDEPGRLQHAGAEPKTLCNGCVVVVPLEGGWPAAEGAPALCVTGTEPAEQGSPVNEFLPIGGVRIVVESDGETGTGGGWITVFPLSIGLVVFPLRSGLLVFCASAIVMVAVRMRTLRPISWLRLFVVIV